MDQTDLDKLYAIARQAGDAIMGFYRDGFEQSIKDDQSPLTQADLASNAIIVEALSTWSPSYPVVSEESPMPAEWPERYWLVDPLDGTKEFINRHGDFTVNIAWVEDGYPVAGVVYAPAQDRGHIASNAVGAYAIDADGSRRKINANAERSGSVKVAVSRSHMDDATLAVLERLRAHYGAVETLSLGSSLKLTMVAEGTVDLYVRKGPTSKWDTAAGQAVSEIAGASVMNLAKWERLNCLAIEPLNPSFAVCSPWMMEDPEGLVRLLDAKV